MDLKVDIEGFLFHFLGIFGSESEFVFTFADVHSEFWEIVPILFFEFFWSDLACNDLAVGVGWQCGHYSDKNYGRSGELFDIESHFYIVCV